MKQIFSFLGIMLLAILGHAQGSFLGIPYHHVKAYKLDGGYEAPRPDNGINVTNWMSKRLVSIMTQAETFQTAGQSNCGFSDKVIFFNAENQELASVSFGMECGRFAISANVSGRNTATDLSEAGIDAIYEVLEEVYINLKPGIPKDTKKITHTVEDGDSWTSIATDYNTTIALLCAANNKKAYMKLKKGMKLIVYEGVKYYAYPSTKPKATSPASTPTSPTIHTVEAKETLYAIAKKYNTTVAALQNLNALTGNDIKIGQVLKIGK